MFAVYHVVPESKSVASKFNRYQADCLVPWVNDVIFLLSVALQKSQDLVDKVIVHHLNCCILVMLKVEGSNPGIAVYFRVNGNGPVRAI